MILTQLTHFFQCKKITRHKLVSNVRDCVSCSPPPSSSSVKVFGDDICSPFLLEVMHGVDEKFIPKKGEACWQRSFYETGGQAFEESSEALLFGYLNHAVEQTSVAPHLHRTDRRQCFTIKPRALNQIWWNMLLRSLPVQSELWLLQSPPPAVSSWTDRMGTWLFCWSFQLHSHRPGFLSFLEHKKWQDFKLNPVQV